MGRIKDNRRRFAALAQDRKHVVNAACEVSEVLAVREEMKH